MTMPAWVRVGRSLKGWGGYVAFLLLFGVTFLVVADMRVSTFEVAAGVAMLAAIPFYFGTRDKSRQVSATERFFATAWLWLRRLLCCGMGLALSLGALFDAFVPGAMPPAGNRWIILAGGLVFGAALIAFGIIGESSLRGWRANVEAHRAHRRRYGWWF